MGDYRHEEQKTHIEFGNVTNFHESLSAFRKRPARLKRVKFKPLSVGAYIWANAYACSRFLTNHMLIQSTTITMFAVARCRMIPNQSRSFKIPPQQQCLLLDVRWALFISCPQHFCWHRDKGSLGVVLAGSQINRKKQFRFVLVLNYTSICILHYYSRGNAGLFLFAALWKGLQFANQVLANQHMAESCLTSKWNYNHSQYPKLYILCHHNRHTQ